MKLLKKNDPEIKILKKYLNPVFTMLEKCFRELGDKHGDNAIDAAYASILATIIHNQSMSILSMKNTDKSTKSQHAQVILAEFALHREVTENAVSMGFSSAMTDFAGYDVDYFCQIIPGPEAVNKEPC